MILLYINQFQRPCRQIKGRVFTNTKAWQNEIQHASNTSDLKLDHWTLKEYQIQTDTLTPHEQSFDIHYPSSYTFDSK